MAFTPGSPTQVSVTGTVIIADDVRIQDSSGNALDSVAGALKVVISPGASTASLQSTGNTSAASIDGKTPALGQALAAASIPVVLTASQLSAITPPTTLTIIQPTGTNLHATVDNFPSTIAVSNFPATQPVSGTVTATQGTSPWVVSGALTDTQLRASAIPVSAASLPLPTNAATSALQTSGNTSLSSIDGKTPVLGQALAAASVPVVLTSAQLSTLTPLSTLTDTQLRATPIPISGTIATGGLTDTQLRATAVPVLAAQSGTWSIGVTSSVIPTGASTSALQTSGNASLSSIDSKTPALGQALAASSVPIVLTSAQLSTLTPLASITVTQPTGTNLHTVIDSSTLPTGAATSANQTNGTQRTLITDLVGNLQPSGDSATRVIFVRPSDGTNNSVIKAASTIPVLTDPAIVVTQSPNYILLTASAPSSATVGVTAATAVTLPSNLKGAAFVNTSANAISLALGGGTAVLNSGITLTANGGSFLMTSDLLVTGIVSAIASAASSNLSIQVFTL